MEGSSNRSGGGAESSTAAEIRPAGVELSIHQPCSHAAFETCTTDWTIQSDDSSVQQAQGFAQRQQEARMQHAECSQQQQAVEEVQAASSQRGPHLRCRGSVQPGHCHMYLESDQQGSHPRNGADVQLGDHHLDRELAQQEQFILHEADAGLGTHGADMLSHSGQLVQHRGGGGMSPAATWGERGQHGECCVGAAHDHGPHQTNAQDSVPMSQVEAANINYRQTCTHESCGVNEIVPAEQDCTHDNCSTDEIVPDTPHQQPHTIQASSTEVCGPCTLHPQTGLLNSCVNDSLVTKVHTDKAISFGGDNHQLSACDAPLHCETRQSAAQKQVEVLESSNAQTMVNTDIDKTDEEHAEQQESASVRTEWPPRSGEHTEQGQYINTELLQGTSTCFGSNCGETNSCNTPRSSGCCPISGDAPSEPASLLPLQTLPSPCLTPSSPSHSTCSATPPMPGPPGQGADTDSSAVEGSPVASPTKSCRPSVSQPIMSSNAPSTLGTHVAHTQDHADVREDPLRAVDDSFVGMGASRVAAGTVAPTMDLSSSSNSQFSSGAATWLGRYWRSSSMSESSTAARHSPAVDAGLRSSGICSGAGEQRAAESAMAESGPSLPAVAGDGVNESLYPGATACVVTSTSRHTSSDEPCPDEPHPAADAVPPDQDVDDCIRQDQSLHASTSVAADTPLQKSTPAVSSWWRASQYAYSLVGSVAQSVSSTFSSSHSNSPSPHLHSQTQQRTNDSQTQVHSSSTSSELRSSVPVSVSARLPLCTQRRATTAPSDLLSSLSRPHSLTRSLSDGAGSSINSLNASLSRLPACIKQPSSEAASLLSLDTGVLTYMITHHLKPNRRACAALRSTCRRLRHLVNSTTTVLQVNGRSMQTEPPTCLALWQGRAPHNCLSHAGFTNVDTLVLKVAERDNSTRSDCPSWSPDSPWPALTPCLQHSVRTVVVHVYGVRVEGRRCEPDVLRVLALLHRLPSLSTLMWVQRGRWSLSDLPLLQQLPTTLTTLYFYHRKMGPMDCMRILMTGLTHLTNLRQLHIHHLPVALLPCLSPLSRLQKVTGVMANSAMALLQLEHMKLGDMVNSVTLNKSKLWLSPAPHLTSLVLNKCQVQPTALKNAAWLKSLKMYSCTSVTRFADLVPLFELRCLTQLHVLSSHATTATNRGQWWLNRALLDALQQLQPDMLAARTLQDLSLVLQVEEAHQFGALPKLGLLGRLQSLSLFFLQGWPTVPCAGPHAAAMLQLLMGHANVKQLKAFHISLYEPSQVLALQTPLTHPGFSQLLTCHLTFHITAFDMPAVLTVLHTLSRVRLHVDLKLEEGSYTSMSDMLRVLCTALCELGSLAEVRLCTPMLNVCPINDADSLLMLRSLSKLQRLEIDTSFGIGSGARVHGDVLDAVQELERIGVSAELLSGYMCLPQRVPSICTLPQRAWVRQLAALLILGWWFLQ